MAKHTKKEESGDVKDLGPLDQQTNHGSPEDLQQQMEPGDPEELQQAGTGRHGIGDEEAPNPDASSRPAAPVRRQHHRSSAQTEPVRGSGESGE